MISLEKVSSKQHYIYNERKQDKILSHAQVHGSRLVSPKKKQWWYLQKKYQLDDTIYTTREYHMHVEGSWIVNLFLRKRSNNDICKRKKIPIEQHYIYNKQMTHESKTCFSKKEAMIISAKKVSTKQHYNTNANIDNFLKI